MLLRSGRLQNARYFFMKNPLQAYQIARAYYIPENQAFHLAGPSLTYSGKRRNPDHVCHMDTIEGYAEEAERQRKRTNWTGD